MSTDADTSRARTRAVIFDFDGTLVESEPHHLAAINETVRPLGWAISDQEMFERFVGTSDRYCFETLAAEHGETLDAGRMDTLQATKLDSFLAAAARGEVTPFEGAVELVRACAERVPVAVCSGSRRASILPVLEGLGIVDVFETIVSADDVERAKPDPASYRVCCERLGVEPDDAVAIEDTDHGIASAKDAGVRTIAVEHSLGRDRLGRADRVFATISKIGLADLGL